MATEARDRTEGGDAAPATPAERPAEIGILGGTGALGRGIAARASRAGITVRVGSRDAERAVGVVEDLVAAGGDAGRLLGGTNAQAAAADLVVVSLPAAGAVAAVADLADHLEGRIVLSAVVPLGFDDDGPHLRDVPSEGSCAQALAAVVPAARVVAGLQAVSAVTLRDPDATLEDDVPLCGDDEEAVQVVAGLVAALGLRPIAAGPLRLAATLEALTPLLISVNKRHRSHAGIALTGL